jgi:hypothetical protein
MCFGEVRTPLIEIGSVECSGLDFLILPVIAKRQSRPTMVQVGPNWAAHSKLVPLDSDQRGRRKAPCQLVFDHRPTRREQHDEHCQASWIDRDCRALYGSSVVALLLADENAIRIA